MRLHHRHDCLLTYILPHIRFVLCILVVLYCISTKLCTRKACYLEKRFCQFLSREFPFLKVQQDSCSTTVEVSANSLKNLFSKLEPFLVCRCKSDVDNCNDFVLTSIVAASLDNIFFLFVAAPSPAPIDSRRARPAAVQGQSQGGLLHARVARRQEGTQGTNTTNGLLLEIDGAVLEFQI